MKNLRDYIGKEKLLGKQRSNCESQIRKAEEIAQKLLDDEFVSEEEIVSCDFSPEAVAFVVNSTDDKDKQFKLLSKLDRSRLYDSLQNIDIDTEYAYIESQVFKEKVLEELMEDAIWSEHPINAYWSLSWWAKHRDISYDTYISKMNRIVKELEEERGMRGRYGAIAATAYKKEEIGDFDKRAFKNGKRMLNGTYLEEAKTAVSKGLKDVKRLCRKFDREGLFQNEIVSIIALATKDYALADIDEIFAYIEETYDHARPIADLKPKCKEYDDNSVAEVSKILDDVSAKQFLEEHQLCDEDDEITINIIWIDKTEEIVDVEFTIESKKE